VKKWEKIAFAAVASAALLIPVYTMPFVGQTSDNAEKRELAAWPALMENGRFNTAFFDGVGDYLADRFTLRAQLVEMQGDLKGAFGVSSEEDVILGTDGWLYFDKTMPDYMGETTLTATQAERLQKVGDLMAEYAESHGATFALTVVPNKATVYPDHLPYYCRVPDSYAVTKPGCEDLTPLYVVNQQLVNRDWYVDMHAALTAEKGLQLYHKRDSHWNNLGARVGYDALMAAGGGKAGAYADTPYTIQSVWDGDLDKLLGSSKKDEQAVWQTDFTYAYTSRFRTEEDILITTACTDGEGHLVMFRDSFANALLPLLAQQYATATFSRALPFALDLTEIEGADTVIVEIVERNLQNLLTYAPKMAAPTRELPAATAEGRYVSAKAVKSGDYIKVSGYTDGTRGVANRIYLAVDGVAYEATPIAEGDPTADNGFTAYLPADCAGKPITLLGDYHGNWIDQGTIN
jgi:hypothetical protein